jgi:FAD/FMN-containing dehydrogenase
MVFQGLTQDEARQTWRPLLEFAKAHPDDYEGQDTFIVLALPARAFWNADVLKLAPGVIVADARPDAAPGDYWWSGNSDEVGVFWHAYASAWMPQRLLKPRNQAGFVDAWFAATRHWGFAFHFNKGLAGAPDAALEASRDTAMNPDVLDAFALAIVADGGPSLFTGASPSAGAHARAKRVQAAMKALRVAAPETGSYVNECDYFQPDWRRAFWGDNYARLAAVKRRYDPDGLFNVHHGVRGEG